MPACCDGVGLIGSGTIAERLYGKPSINVIGIDAPRVDGAANALVPRARARVSVRLAPGQEPAAAQEAVRAHLEAAAPWNVRVRVTAGGVGEGFVARTDGPAYAAATRAMAAAYGKDVVRYGEGGSIPLVAAFQAALPHAEMILWGTEEPRCKIHAPDESVDLGELERCTARRGPVHRGAGRPDLRQRSGRSGAPSGPARPGGPAARPVPPPDGPVVYCSSARRARPAARGEVSELA